MRNIGFAIAAAIVGIGAASGLAEAQSVIRGSGEDTTIVAPNPYGPIWGGAIVRQVGSGESAQIEILDVQQLQQGQLSRLIGSGESNTVVYAEIPTSAPWTPSPVGDQSMLAARGGQPTLR